MSVLSAHGLVVRLGGKTVIDRFTASFSPGQVTAIVGPNGAGKSTLLTCLAGLRKPSAGVAQLGPDSVFDMPSRQRARAIGFLPQTPEIAWAVDVETLVGLGRTPFTGARGLSDADRLAVARALQTTELESFAARTVDTLSGGERGRALIARVLAGEPDWLLADEPLTGLDPGHQLDAADIFRGAAREGRGVILTLHDLAFAARLADRVIVMAEGGILADGAPMTALSPPVLAEAYGIDALVTQGRTGPIVELLGRRGA